MTRPTESDAMGFERFPTNSKGLRLDPQRLLESVGPRIDFDLLEGLGGRSVVSARDFDRTALSELFKFSALLELTEVASHHPLDGKVVVTAFFEASTRTRLSFESAVLRLDGKIVSVAEARTTGVAKKESLADIGEMFNTYGDLVVMRHPETKALEEIRTNLRLPLVNAGNGRGEHPTQAMIDWYTLVKWRPELAHDACPEERRIRLGVVGTPRLMRAVRSFLLMATCFPSAVSELVIVSDSAEPLDPELEDALAKAGLRPQVHHRLLDVLPQLDVVYRNSITTLAAGYAELDQADPLDASSPLRPDAVILHPFARRGELSPELDETPHNLYFAQAASGVFLRQALLIGLLNRVSAVPASVRYLAG